MKEAQMIQKRLMEIAQSAKEEMDIVEAKHRDLVLDVARLSEYVLTDPDIQNQPEFSPVGFLSEAFLVLMGLAYGEGARTVDLSRWEDALS